MNWLRFMIRARCADLYRELQPSVWYLNGTEAWEDIVRFRLFER